MAKPILQYRDITCVGEGTVMGIQFGILSDLLEIIHDCDC